MKYFFAFFTLAFLPAFAQINTEGQKTGEVQTNEISIKLIYIEKGSFMMGSPATEETRYSNETLHKVTLTKPFFIGQTEITQKQWLSIMKVTPQELQRKRLAEKDAAKTAEKKKLSAMSSAEKKRYKEKLAQLKSQQPVMTLKPKKPTTQERETMKKARAYQAAKKKIYLEEKAKGENFRFGENYPMCFVNWTEAMEFCKKLTDKAHKTGSIPQGWHYRLPTEAEWEYAARAGTDTPVYNGKQPSFKDWDSIVEFNKHSWINPNSMNHIHEVGKLTPNAWGLHDTLGNTAEWTLDIHADFNKEAQVDPLVTQGPQMQRVYRGLTAHNGPLDIRTARRKVGGPRVPYWTFFGLRVVLAEKIKSFDSVKDNHNNR